MKDGAAGRTREYALSEVVGFVLLLGVLVAAMALWMMYVVPVNGREDEITQMNGVKDQFTSYKISLDSLWVNDEELVPLSTSMNLGTGGGNSQVSGLFLPMMNPIASSAVLSIEGTGSTRDTLNITTVGPSRSLTTFSYNMSSLQYQSRNNYWIQQTYTYQDGGVFLSQLDGSTCRVLPPIGFSNNTDNSMNVKITPITLIGSGSIGGTGPVRVDSWMKSNEPVVTNEKEYYVNTSVSVSNYTTARMWLDVFNSTRRDGLVYNYYTVGITPPTQSSPYVAFILIKGPNDPLNPGQEDVYLTLTPVQYVVTLNNIVSSLN
jgi:hypothetical protein